MARRAAIALTLASIGSGAGAQPPSASLLADGVKVDLGAGWDVTSMPNPAINSAVVRQLLSDALEIRIRKEGTGILINSTTYKPVNGKTLDTFEGAKIAREAATRLYLAKATETEAVVESQTNGNVTTAFVTLHARADERFNVRPGYPGGCVSTGNLRKGWTVMTVSIASESCDSETHRTALRAFLAAHEEPNVG